MSGTAFSAGQMAELQSIFATSGSTALPKAAAKFGDPRAVLKALKDKNEVLAGRLETAFESAIKGMLTLIRFGQSSLTLSARHEPTAFYRTCSGIYVWEDFRGRIVSKAKPTEAGASFKVNIDELGAELTDEEIENGLPKKHLFDESTLCAIIAEMISKQPNGEAGDLENTGYVNLLYTQSCVVGVGWSSGERGWGVYAWDRFGGRWNAGGRVLSPAN